MRISDWSSDVCSSDLAYRRTRGMKVFTIPADKLGTGKIEISRLSPGAAAIMPYRIRSARGVDEKMAAALVADARPVAASYPNDAFVQRPMAEKIGRASGEERVGPYV